MIIKQTILPVTRFDSSFCESPKDILGRYFAKQDFRIEIYFFASFTPEVGYDLFTYFSTSRQSWSLS
jgi:hypothetical protein